MTIPEPEKLSLDKLRGLALAAATMYLDRSCRT